MRIIVLPALLIIPIFVVAQTSTTPYFGHFREYGTRKVGGKMEQFSREGTKACNSQGQLFEGEYLSNKRDYKSEMIFAPDKHTQYMIDLVHRTALTRSVDMKPFHPPKDPPIGSEAVGNIAATVYPIKNSQTSSVDGKLWVANGTDVILKIFINLPTGETFGYELTDVKIGAEPDHALFTIPSDIKVSQ